MAGLLTINGVPIRCIYQASVIYHVPKRIIVSVLKAENGRIGMAKPNINGTYDYGPMQINTVWLKKIAPYGYTREIIQYDPCANVAVGTWILGQQIANSDNYWQGVGDYHSHTPQLNQYYKRKIKNTYEALTYYISRQTT